MIKKILFLSLIMGLAWGVVFPATYFLRSQDAAWGGTETALACWAGGIATMLASWKMEALPTAMVRAEGKLLATFPRMVIPIIFLLFSINFYRDPIDRDFLLGIIYAYFVYYPLLLITQTILLLTQASENK